MRTALLLALLPFVTLMTACDTTIIGGDTVVIVTGGEIDTVITGGLFDGLGDDGEEPSSDDALLDLFFLSISRWSLTGVYPITNPADAAGDIQLLSSPAGILVRSNDARVYNTRGQIICRTQPFTIEGNRLSFDWKPSESSRSRCGEDWSVTWQVLNDGQQLILSRLSPDSNTSDEVLASAGGMKRMLADAGLSAELAATVYLAEMQFEPRR